MILKVIIKKHADIKTKKNDLGLWEAEATLNLRK